MSARIDLEPLLGALATVGATSTAVLTDAYRETLLEEARRVTFRPARPLVGTGGNEVRQRMEVFDAFAPGSAFLALRDGFQSLFDAALGRLAVSPFASKPVFNDLMLQRYEVGREGITPHRDRTAYRNIICLFVIAGRGRFCVCADRAGRDSTEIPHVPGDVVVTRAPGFLGSDERPFHFVENIEQTRYVFGLRHRVLASADNA